MELEDIPHEVAHQLQYYVYALVHPETKKILYVGKGQGKRALAHQRGSGESRKLQIIQELRAVGKRPRIDILVHGLPDEESAFTVECAVIDALGLPDLTNEVRGSGAVKRGRIPLGDLVLRYGAESVTVTDPSILIRINRLYQPGMEGDELYEATRGVWRLGRRRETAKYAMAVFEGIIREVFEIESWHPAGATEYKTRDAEKLRQQQRWEFKGRVASADIRARYVGKSVAAQFAPGLQTPVLYAACNKSAV